MRIAILGTGNLGTAVAAILESQKLDVRTWDKDPAKCPPGATLASALDGATYVFPCLPSWVLRGACAEIMPFLSADAVVVGMSKGIEPERKETVDELFAEVLPRGQRFAVLSGPMLAAEMSDEKMGAAVVASADASVRAGIIALFRGSGLLTEESSDVHGVALCGVLKNVYALGLGIVGALGWADNARGWFASRAVREMIALTESMGGKSETVLGAAGIGDLIATGLSPHSLNRQYGEALVETGTCDQKSEGCESLAAVVARAGERRSRLPLLDAIARVTLEGQKAADTFGGLLKNS
jgi:glycerol-3-phosphate dehydrogenase (NAD(P)+)